MGDPVSVVGVSLVLRADEEDDADARAREILDAAFGTGGWTLKHRCAGAGPVPIPGDRDRRDFTFEAVRA